MNISSLFKTLLMALGTGIKQVETEIPLITEDDYGKPLLPVRLKTEFERTHSFETIHPVKRIVCKGPKCPLCDAKFGYDLEKLLPVYSMGDKKVKILRIPLEIHPLSLFSAMKDFIAGTAQDLEVFYKTPFAILYEGCFENKPFEFGVKPYPLFKIGLMEPLQDREQIDAVESCVSRFLKRYKPGDLTKSANVNVSERTIKIGLEKNLRENPESVDIADFMDSMPDFRSKTKSIGKFFNPKG